MENKLLISIASLRKNSGLGQGTRNLRDIVLNCVAQLEELRMNPDINSLNGTWSLIYSTRSTGKSVDNGTVRFDTDKIIAAIYKVIFKFLPFFAGSQDASSESDLINVSCFYFFLNYFMIKIL
jgi:hypothetical protein